tara:strand:- start:2609 stop:4048 length:1440 start_codon:yes stop_codon:yes gene_type:complete
MKIKNLLILFSCILVSCSQKKENNENHFSKEFIHDLKVMYVDCDEDAFNTIHEDFKENRYIAVNIEYEGVKWSNVKLRIRGDSSRELPKKSLKLKFPKDSLFNNVRKINLNAEWYDKSYMSQYISSYLMRENGVSCFNSSHTVIYVNEVFYGIFLMVENIDASFLRTRKFSTNSSLFKATKDGACFNDSSEVDQLWEVKSNNSTQSKNRFKEFITEVNNLSVYEAYDYYQHNFEYDELLTTVALNILIGNKSTYYHNYYLLKDSLSSKWSMLPWDMDKTLMSPMLNLHYCRSTWSEGVNSNLPDNTIPELIFLNKQMKFDLEDKLNELKSSTFNNAHLNPIIDSLYRSLDQIIALDVNDNISQVEEWDSAVNELKDFIAKRPAIVLNQIANYPSSFEVLPAQNTTLYWSVPDSETPVVYTIKMCTDFNFKKEQVYSYTTQENTFTPTELPKGVYYYFISAKNKAGSTTGFRIKSTLSVK